MLTRTVSGLRRGVTLVELLVVLIVAGAALALIASISLRQQRTFADLADASALSGQLRDAAAILPIDIRGLSATLGDVREARDTAIEVRATIATAVVCDTGANALLLAPATEDATTLSSATSSIGPGDSAWVYSIADTVGDWRPFRVTTVASGAPGRCGARGPILSVTERATSRVAVGLEPAPGSAAIGMPVRFTRPIRYSLYHASDGGWYLGEREWSSANLRFNTIQPVSGPFLSPSDRGLLLRYSDETGREIASPVADAGAIAMVRVDLRGQPRRAVRILASAGASPRVDSISVVILLRNRR